MQKVLIAIKIVLFTFGLTSCLLYLIVGFLDRIHGYSPIPVDLHGIAWQIETIMLLLAALTIHIIAKK